MMAEMDRRANTPAEGREETDAERSLPKTPARTPSAGAAPIPPNHIRIGGDSPLGEDPISGSVVSEDWGRNPGIEADIEGDAVTVLGEDTVV
jgi:hypothetical protein